MNLLAMLVQAVGRDESDTRDASTGQATENADDGTNRRARCRNCGRYYDVEEAPCPHCGSGNKLRSGPPAGQTRVR
jgi:ribosomal protein L37E